MGNPASLPFEYISKFISSILENKIKEEWKGKESSQIAKEKAYKLYEKLGQMKEVSLERLDCFQTFVRLVNLQATEEKRRDAEILLDQNSKKLMDVTSDMLSSLEALYPQLEIHQYELYQEIDWFRKGWGAGYNWYKISEAIYKADDEGDFSELDILVEEEERDYQRLKECIKTFRKFLSEEFPFPQSF